VATAENHTPHFVATSPDIKELHRFVP